jgi:hypothetical protein
MGGRRDRDEQARNMEAQVEKAKEIWVEMPKYFNLDAVKPLSYAEQVQKRKLIWSKQARAADGGVGCGGQCSGADAARGQASQAPRHHVGDETANE